MSFKLSECQTFHLSELVSKKTTELPSCGCLVPFVIASMALLSYKGILRQLPEDVMNTLQYLKWS